nr:uncharacterized protein LOC124819133 [Hydra vulgaris]
MYLTKFAKEVLSDLERLKPDVNDGDEDHDLEHGIGYDDNDDLVDHNDFECRRKFRLPLHKISEIINILKIDLSPKTDKNNPISPETKGYFAINCQFVVDPDGQFRDAVIKFPGSCHDAFVYSTSTLKQTLELDPASGFLFGDSGYGLSPVMITPFSPPLNPEEILFNKIHSRVRSEIQRCFGRLKNRWCLHKSGGTLQYTPSKCCSIIYTSVILENMCNSLGLEDPDNVVIIEDAVDNTEDNGNCSGVGQRQTNQFRLGIIRRNNFKSYMFVNRHRYVS